MLLVTKCVAVCSAYAILGPTIYVLGGCINDLLDYRFHRWLPGPTIRVARKFAAAGVLHDKIYVSNGCAADTWSRSANWVEVLHPTAGQ
ncbi:hypothetical protein JHK85_033438 [Glycine max]|nr:hypothetical protein JHK85_033438 [Glycine max]